MDDLEMQILDADYEFLDGKPVVRIFGRTKTGKSVCVFYTGYFPYFYAEGDVEAPLKDEAEVKKIERVGRYVLGNGKREIFKISTRNPANTPQLRERLRAAGLHVYEADILFKYRFMNDFGMGGLGWLRVHGKHIFTSTVKTEIKFEAEKIEPLREEVDIPLKYIAFDIECTSPEGVPNPSKDPIIMISMVFSEEYNGKKSVVISPRRGPGVTAINDEKELLEEFIKIVDGFDADILTGYNINNFDIPYILQRMKRLDVKPLFGRASQKPVVSRNIGNSARTSIIGRIIIDSYELIKKDFHLQRYSLDFVAQRLLKQKKEDVKHSEIEKFWKGSEKEFERLVSYARTDSILALNLLFELNLLDKYVALSKVSGTLLQDTVEGGEATRIENFLLREFNKDGYVFPLKPDEKEIDIRRAIQSKELGGGEVLEPAKGLHSMVAVLDFKAMYPSIIKTFNICPTTLVTGPVTSKDEYLQAKSGAMFLPKQTKVGIIPKIVEELMTKRQEVKLELKKVRAADKKRQLYAKQWALKILANAFYGYFGYVRSRLFSPAIANAITATGRFFILETKRMIEERYGYPVIYGDTDSVFIKMEGKELSDIAEAASKITEDISGELPGSMELEFEKVFKRFLPLTKKRYAAWSFVKTKDGWEEGIEMKGIETVRRDWCPLVGITVGTVIEILLKRNDVKEAVKYFKGVVDDLLENKTPVEQLVVTKTMTKTPRHYAGVQPHIELVKKMRGRGDNSPGVGDRVGYVIIKGTQLLSKRAEDPSYVVEKGLQIDSGYYIESQLLPPMERIFKALGISKGELLGNGKQMGLMDVIKAMPQHNISLSDITGFSCSSCGRFYEIPSLRGTCECGGRFAFSSPGGVASRATVA